MPQIGVFAVGEQSLSSVMGATLGHVPLALSPTLRGGDQLVSCAAKDEVSLGIA